MPCIASEFHQCMENLQALLSATATTTASMSLTRAHFDLRRCLRQIQGLLLRDDFFMSEKSERRDKLTQDLVVLLTLEYECEDPSVSELVQSLWPRATDLLTGLALTDTQLQRLWHRILYLLQQESSAVQAEEPLLVLLNHTLELDGCEDERTMLRHIVPDDCDVFDALYVLLSQQHPSFSLHVLIGGLIRHWIQHCLHRGASCEPYTMEGWLQCQFQERRSYSSEHELKSDADEFVERIEQYGLQLVESALQVLEEVTLPQSLQNVATDASCHGPPSSQHEQVLPVLQHTTLAANFIVSLQGTTLYQKTGMAGMGRSLWRTLVHFVVSRLGDGEEDLKFSTLEPSRGVVVGHQLAATDLLWRLAQLYSAPLPQEDAPMVSTTVLLLLKYADNYWNDETVQWVRTQLLDRPHLLQVLRAAILAYLHFPHDDYPQEALESLSELVFCSGDDEEDHWRPWVLKQLTEQTARLEQYGNIPPE